MERLIVAESSSDLADLPEGLIGDVDLLRAAGMVAQTYPIALSAWRVVELGDRHRELRHLFDLLVARCIRLGHDSDPFHVVSAVLTWMIDPICRTCHGRQFETVPGTPVLTDHACPACGGTGKREKDWAAAHHDLHESILADQRMASAAIVRKLKSD